MFNFVFAGFNAKIKINDNFFNIDKNRLQPIDKTFENLTIYAPHNKHAFFVPYTTNKSNCLVYQYANLNATIYCIKPNYFLKQNGKTEIYASNQLTATFITRGKCFVKICADNQTYTVECAELCKNPHLIAINNFLVIYAKNIMCDGYSILIFDLTNKTFVLNKTAFEVKQNANQICVLDYPVITGAAKASVYNLDLNNFEATETYYVKLFEPQKTTENLPTLLFYAVKTKDFNFAKTLLSPYLAASATNQMLENYFAPYTEMYKNPFKDKAYILVNKTTLNSIEFSLIEQLIDNFNIV